MSFDLVHHFSVGVMYLDVEIIDFHMLQNFCLNATPIRLDIGWYNGVLCRNAGTTWGAQMFSKHDANSGFWQIL